MSPAWGHQVPTAWPLFSSPPNKQATRLPNVPCNPPWGKIKCFEKAHNTFAFRWLQRLKQVNLSFEMWSPYSLHSHVRRPHTNGVSTFTASPWLGWMSIWERFLSFEDLHTWTVFLELKNGSRSLRFSSIVQVVHACIKLWKVLLQHFVIKNNISNLIECIHKF